MKLVNGVLTAFQFLVVPAVAFQLAGLATAAELQDGFSIQAVDLSQGLRSTQDFTTLRTLLQKGEFLVQMERWQGKILIVKVEEAQPPIKLNYYYFNSLFADTDGNQILSPGDRGFFNPASTIKVGIAALVLEKLNHLNLSRKTAYRIEGGDRWYRIDEDIRRALVISDNESANRLILLLGFANLNQRLQAIGVENFVVDRLMLGKGILLSSPKFDLRDGNYQLPQPRQEGTPKIACYEIRQQPGNCATADALVAVWMRLVHPNFFPTQEQFALREADRLWLQQIMSLTPRQAGFNYPNHYCRFLLEAEQVFAKPSGKMLSKCGVALFTHTYVDTSYLETNSGEKFYIVFAVTPPPSTSEPGILKWMNDSVKFLLPRLP